MKEDIKKDSEKKEIDLSKIPSISSTVSVPLSILAAGVIIAMAIVYSVAKYPSRIPANTTPKEKVAAQNLQNQNQQKQIAPSLAIDIRPISADDHLWGNSNAPVKIVEFSDTECPFCKYFHSTLRQVVDSSNGQIAWVYRHFPLEQLHPKAKKEAEATECAYEQGDNEKFWAYINRLFEITPSNNQLDPAELPKIAVQVGLDNSKFEECLASGKYAQKVANDLEEALSAGGRGTPFSVIVTSDGKTISFSGALSADQVKNKVAEALGN